MKKDVNKRIVFHPQVIVEIFAKPREQPTTTTGQHRTGVLTWRKS
jgi:hypothetical protein